jgi:hypothetical protein
VLGGTVGDRNGATEFFEQRHLFAEEPAIGLAASNVAGHI